MDMTTLFDSIQSTLGDNLPSILGALVILVLGWVVAVLVRAAVRRSLRFIQLNQKIQSTTGSPLNVENGVAAGAYYIVLLLALIAFFNVLNLHLVSGSLQSLVDQVFGYAPKLAAGGVLILIAWLLATMLRRLVSRTLAATKLDEKLSSEAGMRPMSDSVGNVLYWLVILLFLPGILGALGLQGLLHPMQNMVDEILGLVPNIFGAVVIGLVGWFVARLLRDLVSNLLTATGVDRLGERAGLRQTMTVSKLVGLLVYIFVLVPALIAALDALKIEAISAPATDMLGMLMAAVPNILAATIILWLAWFIAGFVATLVTNLLEGVGFNELPQKLGIGGLFSGGMTAARFVGKVVVFFAMVFATVEAANRLGFLQVSDLVGNFIEFGGQVLLGVVIIAVGLWIAGLAHRAIRGLGGKSSAMYAGIARFTVLGLVFAMGLRAMGIADDIVNLAFGLTLGAIAVAAALSFGLGGREAAGKQMEHWLSRLRGGR